jgi:hypothetical protein
MTREVMVVLAAASHGRSMTSDPTSAHRSVYLANATVLLAHQVDAAYWQEWRLFGLPGGVQLFVLLNLPILLAVLVGAERLGSPVGHRISCLLAASGVFAAVFHGGHLVAGDEAFRTPVSLGLLALTAVLSPLQLAVLRRTGRPGDRLPAAPRGRRGTA